MQLLYNVIKNGQIAYGQKGVVVADIKIEDHIEDEKKIEEHTEETVKATEDSDNSTAIDIEKIYAEIKEQLYRENEKERKSLIEKTMAELKEEAEGIKKEAQKNGYRDGLQAGYKKGMKECTTECDEMKKSAISLIQQAKEEVESYFNENKDKIIQLAADMAECIVHNNIDLSDENILLLIKPIIQLYEDNENIIITCASENKEFLRSRVSELATINRNTRFTILSDGNLKKNDCIIENENKIVDLQIRKQIDSIVDDIKNMED